MAAFGEGCTARARPGVRLVVWGFYGVAFQDFELRVCAKTVQLTLFFGIEANGEYLQRPADEDDNGTKGEAMGARGKGTRRPLGDLLAVVS